MDAGRLVEGQGDRARPDAGTCIRSLAELVVILSPWWRGLIPMVNSQVGILRWVAPQRPDRRRAAGGWHRPEAVLRRYQGQALQSGLGRWVAPKRLKRLQRWVAPKRPGIKGQALQATVSASAGGWHRSEAVIRRYQGQALQSVIGRWVAPKRLKRLRWWVAPAGSCMPVG